MNQAPCCVDCHWAEISLDLLFYQGKMDILGQVGVGLSIQVMWLVAQ